MSRHQLKTIYTIIIATFVVVSSNAQAGCYCVKEWIWGGCAVHECYSELSGGGGAAGNGLGYDKVNIKNDCARKIQAGIRFKDTNGNWTTNGWYTLLPGQQAYVANTKNRTYYIYAETVEPEQYRLKWEGEDTHSSIHGSSTVYGFFKRQITIPQWGTWTQNLKCDGMSRFHALAVAWNAQGFGSIQSANTVQEATTRAINSCNNLPNSGGNCTAGPTVNTSSYACLALARSGNRLFSSIRGNLAEAELNALQSCTATLSGCTVALKFCND